MRVEEIEARLTSSDTGVLEQARSLVNELLSDEMSRGSSAEARARTTLGVTCVVAGLGVNATRPIFSGSAPTPWLLVLGYAVALVFLIRGAYYCIRTVSPQTQFVTPPDVIFEWQDKSYVDSLRAEIALKLRQYELSIRPNSYRLYWLTRAQRGLLFGVLFLSAYDSFRNRAGPATVDSPSLGELDSRRLSCVARLVDRSSS